MAAGVFVRLAVRQMVAKAIAAELADFGRSFARFTSSVRFRVEGLEGVSAALNELPRATQTAVVRRALMKAGAPIEDDAAARAPMLRGDLQRSFTTGTKLSRRQKRQHKKESQVEIFVGPGALTQAVTQEFGTSHHPAQPFMRPAFDSNKKLALDTFTNEIKNELAKSVKRLEAKARREMAKGGFRR